MTGAVIMMILVIIIANVAGIYYWRQEREKGSQGTVILCTTLQKMAGFIACPFCLQ